MQPQGLLIPLKKYKIMNKRVTLAFIFSTLLMILSCKDKKEEKEESVVYPVTSPVKMDTVINKEFVSQIRSERNIEIRAQEKGFLEKIYVDEGQHVQAGQVLFRIMHNFIKLMF